VTDDGTVVGRWTSVRMNETMIVDRAKSSGRHAVAYVGRAKGGVDRLPLLAPADEIRACLERGSYERVPYLASRERT
jgi:hypothetical protein